jgi:tRNA threonylcarbamoyladenosine biosynthesis protein TsaB
MNFPYSTNPVCALFDARKNELYGGLYDCISGTPVPMLAETVLPAEQFMQLVTSRTGSPLIIAGEGVVRYQETLATLLGERARIAPNCHNTVRAANGALLAYNCYQKQGAGALSSLLPHYIRPSDAEIARLAKIVTHE